jgi:predicted MFS family arabinose efflux permease
MDRSSLSRLRRQPGYPLFYATATVTRLADEMFSVGAVLLVLERTGSAALAGATVAAITLPSVLTGPLLGAWLDRSGRRRNVMIIDQVLAATTLVALVLLTGHAPDWIVPMVVLGAGLTWPLSFGGFTSLIPVIVPDELLPPANALEATSFNLAVVTGPALAGTISAIWSPATSLLVEATLTLAAIGLIAAIPAMDRGRGAQRRSLREIVNAGLRHVVKTPPLRGVTVAGALNLGGLGLLTVAFPFFAVDALDVHRGAAGYLWAAFAAGSAVGALVLVRLQTIWPPERVVIGALTALGCLMLFWPLASSLPVALFLIAVAGFADGPNLSATFAVRQRWTPRALHGQIFTTAASLKVGSFSVGAAIAGPVVVGFGSRATLVLAASAQLVAAAAGLLLSGGAAFRRAAPAPSALDLEQEDDVDDESDREPDRPAVQVSLDERAAPKRAAARATDAEGSRKPGVLAGVQQDQEDQDDRQKDLNDAQEGVHRVRF